MGVLSIGTSLLNSVVHQCCPFFDLFCHLHLRGLKIGAELDELIQVALWKHIQTPLTHGGGLCGGLQCHGHPDLAELHQVSLPELVVDVVEAGDAAHPQVHTGQHLLLP
jgi:hypothetical protein